ncbi:hypothetical protein T439DRAFT_79527 [Meredithblackwellia eburnea MCA 4105]
MPRQSRSSRPAARPAAAPAQQSRGAHTQAAQPPAQHHAPPAGVPAQVPVGQKQPGMFAQVSLSPHCFSPSPRGWLF